VALDRQVALTIVDPDRNLSTEQVEAILARTLTLSRIERPGLARVLDVTTNPTEADWWWRSGSGAGR